MTQQLPIRVGSLAGPYLRREQCGAPVLFLEACSEVQKPSTSSVDFDPLSLD